MDSEKAGVLEPSRAVAPGRLGDRPLITIVAGRSGSLPSVADLWAYRELLYFLVLRDVKVRYKQTVLGVAWVVMQPLLMTIIFAFFLGTVVKIPSEGVPYALLVCAGLLPWTFLSSAVTTSGQSLIGSANLITKVYFPRMVVPMAAVGARLVDFAVSFLVLIGIMVYYRVELAPRTLAVVPLVMLTVLLGLGSGLLVAALNVKYRDVGIILPVVLQLWMFASPVIYPSNLVYGSPDVPGLVKTLYVLNPVVGVVDGFRSALLDRPFDLPALAGSALFAAALLLVASRVFRSAEREFADVV